MKWTVFKLLLVGLLFPFGCGIRTELNPQELQWVNVYKPGDTLVFRSSEGQYDTCFISAVKIYYPEYIPFEVHGKYWPQEGHVIYKNKRIINHPNGIELIRMSKKMPKNDTQIIIDFLNSKVISTYNDLELIKSSDEIYLLNTFHPKAENTDPKLILWHKKYGIVKYVTHGNDEWVLDGYSGTF